jgi:beta-glucosidase
MIAAAAAATPAVGLAADTRAANPRRQGFLWGTAISGHQSEGGNVNADTWLLENLKPTVYKERSGDACDSYHRYAEDIALNAALGFNAYRFGIEWSPDRAQRGLQFSNAALDHYVTRAGGLPRQGPDADRHLQPLLGPAAGSRCAAAGSGRTPPICSPAIARWRPGGSASLMGRCTTFNEANVQLLVQVMGALAPPNPIRALMLAAARQGHGLAAVHRPWPIRIRRSANRSCSMPTARATRRSRPSAAPCRSGSA